SDVCASDLLMLKWEHTITLENLMSSKQPSAEPELPPDTITPIPGSRHLMVSAFKDHRLGGAIRVISIICRQELQPLYCVLCANTSANANADGALNQCAFSQAKVNVHSDDFGFSFVTSDVFCMSLMLQQATHVSITANPYVIHNLTFLSIQNQEVKESFRYSFTVRS